MTDLLPPWPLLAAFLLASLVLAVTPGPGVLYIVARSLAQGRQAGLVSVMGVALGNLGNAIGAAVGLAALLAASSAAFIAVKYAGAAYLVYLGAQALRSARLEVKIERPGVGSLRRVCRDGFVIALLNPKTAVFFAAFLPQFLVTESSITLQSIMLGSLFVAIAAMTDTAYVVVATAAAVALFRTPQYGVAARYLAGSTLVGLGISAVFSDIRSSK